MGYNNTNGKDFSLTDKTIRNKDVRPDQIQGAGALIRIIAPPNPIPKETRWYKWEQSVFIEVKYTNRNEQNIPANINDNQILGYIDVLKNMDDGWYAKTTGFVIPTETSFVKKKINAANYGGATIHLVVPSGVTIDNLIYTTAANANVKVYLSFMQYRPVSNPFSSESFQYRVTEPECKNCTILKSGSKFFKLGVLPLGVITYGQWQKN